MTIPKWNKQAPGHYILSDGAFEIIKGKPDWSQNDGRFPSTEWHLFDIAGNLIESNRNYSTLAWDIEYKYRIGKLGEAQPTHRYRFVVDLHIEKKTRPNWSDEIIEKRFERSQQRAREHPSHALSYDVRYLAHKSKATLVKQEEIDQEDGSILFRNTWEYETTPGMWEFSLNQMKKMNRQKGSIYGKIKGEKNPIKENV